MTLTITVTSRDLVAQCADFRLSDLRTGKWTDFAAHKQVVINCKSLSALVCFTGIGHTGALDVSSWMARTVRELPFDVQLIDLLGRFLDFTQYLSTVPKASRHHTFVLTGFDGIQPYVAVVSNFESIADRPQATAQRSLTLTSARPRRPRIFLGGSGAQHVTRDERNLMISSLDVSEPGLILDVMARVNARVSQHDRHVSEACFASWLRSDGRGGAQPFAVPDNIGFIPEFSDVFEEYGIRVPPAVDEIGNPKPLRIAGMSFSRLQHSSRTHHEKNLQLHPDSVDVWNNWGKYLLETGNRIDEAEAAFRHALELQGNHSHPLGNLGYVAQLRGDLSSAAQYYERAVKCDPSNAHQRRNLARFLVTERSERTAAVELIEEGLRIEESDLLRAELTRLTADDA